MGEVDGWGEWRGRVEGESGEGDGGGDGGGGSPGCPGPLTPGRKVVKLAGGGSGPGFTTFVKLVSVS